MKKPIILIIIAVLILLFAGCGSSRNDILTDEGKAILLLQDTGIDVKNTFGRVYHIIKDKNGFLYYCSDVENDITAVLDENGDPTKDLLNIK